MRVAKKRLTPNQAQKILTDAQDENSRVASLEIEENAIIMVPSDYWDRLTNNAIAADFQEYVDSEQGRIGLNRQKIEQAAARAAKEEVVQQEPKKAAPEFLKMGDNAGDIKRRIKGGLAQTKMRLRKLFFEQIPAISNASEGGDAQLFKELYDEAIKSIRVLGLDDNVALDFIEKESALPYKHPEIEVLNQIKRLTEAAAEKEKMLEREEAPEVIQMAMSRKLDIPAEKISGVE
jgi:hypothetical protein